MDRRAFLKLTAICGFASGVAATGFWPGHVASQEVPAILLVSRERLLRESAIASRLQEAEQRMTEQLQSQIDLTKEALAEEEAELARLRSELSTEVFQARIENFDERMRMARQLTQERAAALQRGFQEARAQVVAAIPVVMEQLRRETGATVIMNADQAMAADPALDLTDRAVALFNAIGPSTPIPEIDLTLPVTELISQEKPTEDGKTE